MQVSIVTRFVSRRDRSPPSRIEPALWPTMWIFSRVALTSAARPSTSVDPARLRARSRVSRSPSSRPTGTCRRHRARGSSASSSRSSMKSLVASRKPSGPPARHSVLEDVRDRGPEVGLPHERQRVDAGLEQRSPAGRRLSGSPSPPLSVRRARRAASAETLSRLRRRSSRRSRDVLCRGAVRCRPSSARRRYRD